jgi:hypothetical protein
MSPGLQLSVVTHLDESWTSAFSCNSPNFQNFIMVGVTKNFRNVFWTYQNKLLQVLLLVSPDNQSTLIHEIMCCLFIIFLCCNWQSSYAEKSTSHCIVWCRKEIYNSWIKKSQIRSCITPWKLWHDHNNNYRFVSY